jgi:hypothetical protein
MALASTIILNFLKNELSSVKLLITSTLTVIRVPKTLSKPKNGVPQP